MLEKVPESLSKVSEFRTVGTKPLGGLVVGCGLALKTGEELRKFTNGGKVLLVTDKTMISVGTEKIVSDSLRASGHDVVTFDEVEPEPHLSTCRKVQEIVRGGNFSAIVGLGGGSPMDMAKTAAITATNPKDIRKYLMNIGKPQGEAEAAEPFEREGLPCILLPTTSGTGSEVSPYIIASEGNRKLGGINPYLYGTMALVDPLLTVTMPPKITACTGLDALSHGMEGMIGKMVPITEVFTSKCVEYVFRYLPMAVEDGENIEARYYMSFASVFGMMSYTQGGGLYAHSMSYVLTLDGGHPHGLGCGIALPYTMMFNFDLVRRTLLKLASAVAPDASGSEEEMAEIVVGRFRDLLKRVGLPSSLKELGIEESRIDDYASQIVKIYYRPNNPRPMEIEEARKLVRSMWEGKLVKI